MELLEKKGSYMYLLSVVSVHHIKCDETHDFANFHNTGLSLIFVVGGFLLVNRQAPLIDLSCLVWQVVPCLEEGSGRQAPLINLFSLVWNVPCLE